eukprot:m.78972 g.78972  ORF g.78972 m.78972 type:complete len:182 (-) comp19250_c0_seq1:252-797(-)
MTSAGLALLEECGDDVVEKLTHRVIDGVVGRTMPRVLDFGKMLSPTKWRQLTTALEGLVRSVGRSPSFEAAEALKAAGVADGKSTPVSGALAARADELRSALLLEAATIGTSTIQNFDWNVAVAVASDQISTLNEPLMQLSFTVAHPDGSEEEVRMELSNVELRDLIAKLEAANKVVRELA